MRATIADAVHPIIQCGISLRDRLEAGEPIDWDVELATLRERFAALDADVGPSDSGVELDDISDENEVDERHQLTRATVRFALTCWLDDFLHYHSTFGPQWRERTRESDLDGASQGGKKFWDEARYAETRGDLDSLEVMHLCVMLGYRGEWRAKAAVLESWITRVGRLLDKGAPTWTNPASLTPEMRATPEAADPYRRLAFTILFGFSLVVPATLVLMWRPWAP